MRGANPHVVAARAGRLLNTVGQRSKLPMIGFLVGTFYSLLLWGWLVAFGWFLLSLG